MRPRVLLDIDGVVCDFLSPFILSINSHMGANHELKAMTQWNCYDSFDVPQDVRDLVDAEVHEPGYCLSLEPYPGALDGARALMELADVYVVTSPWSSATWESERRAWIKRHLGLGGDNVISTRAKHVCAGDVLVDDKTETLERWGRCHPDGLPIRWAGHANRTTSYNGVTTDSWQQVIALVMEHEERHRFKIHRAWRNE